MIPLLLLATQAASYPTNASFDFSGTPRFPGVQANAITVRTHNAGLEIAGLAVKGSTVTEIKNNLKTPITLTLVFPRRRVGDEQSGPPMFEIQASWNKTPLALHQTLEGAKSTPVGKLVEYRNDLTATVTLAPLATAGLRTAYRIPLGQADLDKKLKLTGYVLNSDVPVGVMNVAFRTRPGAVIGLPTLSPKDGWQVGEKGAFAKFANVATGENVAWITFYTSRIEDRTK